MDVFATYFDSHYLLQGLALWKSLRRHSVESQLFVLCLDDAAFSTLQHLQCEGMTLVSLDAMDSKELQIARGNRQWGEFCWTLTPIFCRYILHTYPDVARVTYVDSDLYFFRSPQKLLEEMCAEHKTILITPHDYSKSKMHLLKFGRYCVQFTSFGRDEASTAILERWAQQCLEWCYGRLENGKFGDQGYLDAWPALAPASVHELKQCHLALGLWNHDKYLNGQGELNELPVFFHFHGLRLFSAQRVRAYSAYRPPKQFRQQVYAPYLQELAEIYQQLLALGQQISWHTFPQGMRPRVASWVRRICDTEWWTRLPALSELPQE